MKREKKERFNKDDKEAGKKKIFKKKACKLCGERIEEIDYKDLTRLQRFVSERGKIIPSRITGSCAKHQRQLKTAIKRARFISLLPYTAE